MHAGVTSFGCEKSIAQDVPIHSWKRIRRSRRCTAPDERPVGDIVAVLELPQPSVSKHLKVLRDVAKAKENLRAIGDAGLGNVWRAVEGDKEVIAMPVGAILRFIMLNHWYHHRGQLSVYLRELGVPVPSIYGPSADENPFATSRTSAAAV